MKTYNNHKFKLVYNDEDIVPTTNKTDTFCVILALIGIALFFMAIIFVATSAKAESRLDSVQDEHELCNLMDFNGSTYRCEEI